MEIMGGRCTKESECSAPMLHVVDLFPGIMRRPLMEKERSEISKVKTGNEPGTHAENHNEFSRSWNTQAHVFHTRKYNRNVCVCDDNEDSMCAPRSPSQLNNMSIL